MYFCAAGALQPLVVTGTSGLSAAASIAPDDESRARRQAVLFTRVLSLSNRLQVGKCVFPLPNSQLGTVGRSSAADISRAPRKVRHARSGRGASGRKVRCCLCKELIGIRFVCKGGSWRHVTIPKQNVTPLQLFMLSSTKGSIAANTRPRLSRPTSRVPQASFSFSFEQAHE